MIVASAIKLSNGKVFTGERHNHAFAKMRYLYEVSEGLNKIEIIKLINNSVQGFINDQLQFLTREESLIEAHKCNQIVSPAGFTIGSVLMSEDLW